MNCGCQHACTTSRSGNSSHSGRVKNQSMISACNAGLSSTSARKAACCFRFLSPHPGCHVNANTDPGAVSRIRRVPRNGIQFVIAHDGEGSTGIDHAAHDMHRADLRWAAVDKVSDEDRLSFGVTPGAGRVAIAERAEKCLQLVRLPVDVPDDVIRHVSSALHCQRSSQ